MKRSGQPSNHSTFARFVETAQNLVAYGGLPSLEQASDIWDTIWYVEALNSTGIEGSTLTLKEVKALLQQERSVGGKKLKEYLEVESYAKAAKWVYSQARAQKTFIPDRLLSVTELRFIHELLLEGSWKVSPQENTLPNEAPGAFRERDILYFDEGMTPPPFTDVLPQVMSWVSEVNQFGQDVKNEAVSLDEIPIKLAQIHCAFERIHPFLDGNGRAGRLVLNLILVRLGFPPAIILKARRVQHIKALSQADKGNYVPLAEIIAKAVRDNVDRFIVPSFAQNPDWVSLDSLVTKQMSYRALRQAAYRGRLEIKIGDDGFLYSTREAVDEYIRSKYKKGREA
jgi:fido (protein-threonine AMPylation protein)